jgi:hypothetical protein
MDVGSGYAGSGQVERQDANRRRADDYGAELLALLRATLGTEEPPGFRQLETCDWTRLAAIAAHHAVGPIVYQAVGPRAGGRAAGRPPAPVARVPSGRDQQPARSWISAPVLGSRLSPARVSGVLLKGAALVRTLYTDPGLRHVGDVDLLVDERDVPRAGLLLDAMGFRRVGRPLRTEWPTCEFHLVYHRDGHGSIPVELHWRLFEDYLPYVFDLAEVRAQARPIAGLPAGMSTMSPEHELAHLCIHLERHALVYRSLLERPDWLELLVMPRGLARLAWLYDIALYLQRRGDTLDWDRIVADARRWIIDGRLRVVLELCERAFHVGAPAEAIRALGRSRPGFVEGCAHRAVIALNRVGERVGHGAAPSRRLLRWLDFLGDRVTGWSHMWNSLFPPAGYLAARHPGRAPMIGLRASQVAKMTPPVLHAIARRLRLERRRVVSPLARGRRSWWCPGTKRTRGGLVGTRPARIDAMRHRSRRARPRYLMPERQGSRRIHVVRFDPDFFRNTTTYSALLISAGFYAAFASYDFILIHQLDVFVFRDELADWCARGYDYIGAPWFDVDWFGEVRDAWPPATRDNVVGNGGFSLRRCASASCLRNARRRRAVGRNGACSGRSARRRACRSRSPGSRRR